ncbi:hypothetical protein [Paenibacillus sp. NPDC057967]|uniref:hypothetical protein n=1 Tax=Paenibacillus sp. NPDC057967 TaxID=3346293 RepID=UPI0036D93601
MKAASRENRLRSGKAAASLAASRENRLRSGKAAASLAVSRKNRFRAGKAAASLAASRKNRLRTGKGAASLAASREETAAGFDKVKAYAVPGAEHTMNRLGEHLARMILSRWMFRK